MSEKQNPFEQIFKTCENLAHCIQSHLSQIISPIQQSPSSNNHHKGHPQFSITTTTTGPETSKLTKAANPVTKEELGRATWTLLHTLAAQLPEHPTRQQKKDVKELMAILSRLYPCRECADHFKDVLRANPVQAGSQAEFSQWLCHVHNVVNRSLGKLVFPCQRIDARWGKLECIERACDLEGASTEYRRS